MKRRNRINIVVLIFFSTFGLEAQKLEPKESLVISKVVNDFFGWYIATIKQKKHDEFQPSFVESKSGMTTLNFTKYFKNLAKYGFSDSLLEKEKNSYQHCINELKKVKYIDFNTNFSELDDLETIQCDFTNYYRWTGGQEPIDGIRIKTVKFVNKVSATVLVEYYDYDSKNRKNNYFGRNLVKMNKIKDIWKIQNINWK